MGLTLLVASAGGHLAELYRLRSRLPDAGSDSFWITVDHPHGRSLLADEETFFVPDAPSRNIGAAIRNAALTVPLLRKLGPTWVVSNGASLAVSVLPLAAAMGVPCTYIENSVRVGGPSLAGRLVSYVPGISVFTQYPHLASPRWRLTGSFLDAWQRAPSEFPRKIQRVVVTVGTTEWTFRRLFEQLVRVIPPDCDVVWQTGATDVSDLGLSGVRFLPSRVLERAVKDADLVIAHAGIGAAVLALDAGKVPILVPRLKAFGEAVDDHQVDVARELARRGLCFNCNVERLDGQLLQQACAAEVAPRIAPPTLVLGGRDAGTRPPFLNAKG